MEKPSGTSANGVEFHVLGALTVVRDGRVCELGPPRQRAVLARLLMSSPATVAAERLIEDVWAGRQPASALGVLQAHISTLRRVLEPDRAPRAAAVVLVTRPPGYAVNAVTDAQRFARLAARAQEQLHTGDAPAALAAADAALALWGPPYAEFADQEWATAELARLEGLRALADEQRMTALLALGRPQEVVLAAQSALARDSLHEGVWHLLATALYQSGRQADALGALRRARAVLSEQLGLDPGPDLQVLEGRILRHDPDLIPQAPVGEVKAGEAPADPPGPESAWPGQSGRASDPMTGEEAQPLLGRADALAAVAAAAAVAEGHRFQSVVLTGEAGIGKTRLAAEAEAALASSWQVVWGRCMESDGAPALWPWLQALESLGEEAPLPAPLRALVTGDPAPTTSDVVAARFAQHQRIAQYLTAVASDRPLLVILDDLQWADAASLALLADLPILASRARMLLLITARALGSTTRLGDVLAELARHGGARLPLRGLGLADVEAWARRLGLDVDARELLERTAGNPFLLGQSLSTLAVSGGSSEALPVAAMDLLRQRVTRLTAEAQSLLQIAALVGREVDVDLLIAVSGAGEEAVLEALDSAVAQGVLAGSASELRFTHDLMRDTVRETLRPVQGARLHLRVLAVLEQSPVPDVFALADHAGGAASLDPAAAARWAVAAADLSERRLAYDDAVRWWRRALEVSVRVRTKIQPSRAEMLLRLTAALLGAGNAVEALTARALLLQEISPDNEPELEARALTAIDPPSIWLVQQYGETPHALIARLESALDRNPARDATRSRLLASLANALGYTQDPRRSTLSHEAVEIATDLDDPYALGYALNATYFALDADFGEWREVPAIARRLFEIDHRHHLPAYALLGHLMLLPAKVAQYEVDAADAHAVEARRLAQRLRLPLAAFQIKLWEASRAGLQGDFYTANTLLDELAETALPWWSLKPLIAISRLGYLLLEDRLAEAGSLLPTIAWVHAPIAHDVELIVNSHSGHPATAPGEPAKAEPWPEIPRDWLWSTAITVRACAAIHSGGAEHRRAAYSALLPYTGLIATNGTTDGGPVDYWLGRLAASLDDPAAAQAHFGALRRLATGAGLHWWVGRI